MLPRLKWNGTRAVGLVCGFIKIERNIQLDPNWLTILYPWLKFVLLDCLDCLLIQPHTKTANDTNVARISIGLNNQVYKHGSRDLGVASRLCVPRLNRLDQERSCDVTIRSVYR